MAKQTSKPISAIDGIVNIIKASLPASSASDSWEYLKSTTNKALSIGVRKLSNKVEYRLFVNNPRGFTNTKRLAEFLATINSQQVKDTTEAVTRINQELNPKAASTTKHKEAAF